MDGMSLFLATKIDKLQISVIFPPIYPPPTMQMSQDLATATRMPNAAITRAGSGAQSAAIHGARSGTGAQNAAISGARGGTRAQNETIH